MIKANANTKTQYTKKHCWSYSNWQVYYRVGLIGIGILLMINTNVGDGIFGNRTYAMIGQILFVIREFLFISAMHLSFKFSHRAYEKCYCCCDGWMKECCHRIPEEKYKDVLIAGHKKKMGKNVVAVSGIESGDSESVGVLFGDNGGDR